MSEKYKLGLDLPPITFDKGERAVAETFAEWIRRTFRCDPIPVYVNDELTGYTDNIKLEHVPATEESIAHGKLSINVKLIAPLKTFTIKIGEDGVFKPEDNEGIS